MPEVRGEKRPSACVVVFSGDIEEELIGRRLGERAGETEALSPFGGRDGKTEALPDAE